MANDNWHDTLNNEAAKIQIIGNRLLAFEDAAATFGLKDLCSRIRYMHQELQGSAETIRQVVNEKIHEDFARTEQASKNILNVALAVAADKLKESK